MKKANLKNGRVKRSISLLLCAVLLCVMLPVSALPAYAAVYSGDCGADGSSLTWSFDADTGEFTIIGSGAMQDYASGQAPSFPYKDQITSVVIGGGVTHIGSYAFESCNQLSTLTIPENVTSIGEKAFFSVSFTWVNVMNQECALSSDVFSDAGHICCFEGSTAEAYAIAADIPYGHDPVADDCTDATCTEDGIIYGHCAICGQQGEMVLPAPGHDFSEWTTTIEVSCETDGEEQRTCSSCGAIETRVIKAPGHDFSEWTTDIPSCTVDGQESRSCTRCGFTETIVLPAHGHDFHTSYTPATCTEGGCTICTCSNCGETYTEEEIEPLGHEYAITVLQDATLSQEGEIAVYCDRCGDQKNVILPILSEEDYAILRIPVTCLYDGLVAYTWLDTAFGTYSVSFVIPARGHSYTETSLDDGRTEHRCAYCGDIYYTGGKKTLGDVDNDKEVSILDATVIQRYLAEYAVKYPERVIECGDADNDGGISICDATIIQRYIAGYEDGYPIGQELS